MNDEQKENLLALGISAGIALALIVLAIMFFYGFVALFTGHIVRALFCIGIPVWIGLTTFIWRCT